MNKLEALNKKLKEIDREIHMISWMTWFLAYLIFALVINLIYKDQPRILGLSVLSLIFGFVLYWIMQKRNWFNGTV